MPTTLLHISDIHFGTGHFRGPTCNPELLAIQIANLAKKEKVAIDCIVISGDITHTGDAEEFRTATNFIDFLTGRLGLSRKAAVVVPGNHDLNWKSAADGRSQMWGPYRHFFSQLYNRPIRNDANWYTSWWRNGDTFILGLNSCVFDGPDYPGIGAIDPLQWEDALEQLGPQWDACDLRIVVLHHHLVPVMWTDTNKGVPHKHPSLTLNAEQIMAWLVEHKFQLALHGHQHFPFLAGESRFGRRSKAPGGGMGAPSPHILVAGAGSLGAVDEAIPREVAGRSFAIIEASSTRIAVRSFTFTHGDDFDLRDALQFPAQPARTSDSLSRIVANLDQRREGVLTQATRHRAADQSVSTLLRLPQEDLLTLYPSFLAEAKWTALATTALPTQLWQSDLGDVILKLNARKAKIRRLFIGDVMTPSLRPMMKHQQDHGVDVRHIPAHEYRAVALSAVRKLAEVLRSFGIEWIDLERIGAVPHLLAVAIYGRGEREFLGFDVQMATESEMGLLLDPPGALLRDLRSSVETAWNHASDLDALEQSLKRRRTLVLFGAHRLNRQTAIRDALQCGSNVVLAHAQGEDLADAGGLASIVHGVVEFPGLVSPPGAWEKAFEDLKERNDWRGVAFDDYVAEAAARLTSLTPHPCFPLEAAENTRSKPALRRMWNRLAEHNDRLAAVPFVELTIDSPGQGIDEHISEASRVLAACPPPYIVKPAALSASIEIAEATDVSDAVRTAHEAVARLTSVREYAEALAINVPNRIVIEGMIKRNNGYHPCAEYSAEYLTCGPRHLLIGITEKWINSDYIEIAHAFPAPALRHSTSAAVDSAVSDLLTQLSVGYALSHWEFIIDAREKVALVEGHLRPGGDRIMELVEVCTGVNPVKSLFRWLLGEDGTIQFEPRRRAGVFFLRPAEAIQNVSVVERRARRSRSIGLQIDESAIKARSDPWSKIEAFTDKLASVIVEGELGDGIDMLREKAEAAANSVWLVGQSPDGRAIETRLTCAL